MALFLLRGGGLLTALLVAGCGGTQPASPAAPASIDRELATAVFPDAAYEADGERLYEAQERLIGRCMAERGHAYRAAAALAPPPSADALPSGNAGYGLARLIARADSTALRSARAPQHNPQARLLARMAPRRRAQYERALLGDGGRPREISLPGAPGLEYEIGGCTARALTRLYGDVDAYYRGVAMRNAVATAVSGPLEGDRRLLAAGRGWRSCMAAGGHRVRSPSDARDRIYRAYVRTGDVATVRPRERATAAADRRCGLRSGFYREQARARRAVLAALSPQHVRWARAWSRIRAQAVVRAARRSNEETP